MIDFKITNTYNNKKIVNILLDLFPKLTISCVHKALRKKDILVNGNRIKDNINVYEGDRIVAFISIPAENLDIIYNDENILIVNKPAGISVTENSSSIQTLTSIVQDSYKNAKPCHRLDRNTSGLVIFAKNKRSMNILLDKFRQREIDKYYVCIVKGIPRAKKKTLTAYLFKDTKKSIVYISDTPKRGLHKIITSYSIIESNKEKKISLLEIKLETGRTHQIRAHLAHIGYPIIGDGKYGINEVNKSFKQKYQLLMSYKLKFAFKTDAGILNYLKDKEFEIDYSDLKKKVSD